MKISYSLLIILCFVCSTNSGLAKDIKPNQPVGASNRYLAKLEDAEVQVYKSVDQVKLRMFVFQPQRENKDRLCPAIVFFFGGGWRAGSPAQFAQQAKYFASRGMVAMVADYRVSSRHGTKAIHCVADAKSAIRWIREHAEQLGIDAEKIVAAGGSAGGHIAACTGVLQGMDEENEKLEISSRPNAMVLFNPALVLAPVDGKNLLGDRAKTMKDRVGDEPLKISPYHHVKPGQPPTIIFFGTNDNLLQGAEYFTKAARQAGNRCELMTWKDLKHGFFNFGRNDNIPYVETLQAADRFLSSLGFLEGEPTIKLP